jgi:hypothetical protein
MAPQIDKKLLLWWKVPRMEGYMPEATIYPLSLIATFSLGFIAGRYLTNRTTIEVDGTIIHLADGHAIAIMDNNFDDYEDE